MTAVFSPPPRPFSHLTPSPPPSPPPAPPARSKHYPSNPPNTSRPPPWPGLRRAGRRHRPLARRRGRLEGGPRARPLRRPVPRRTPDRARLRRQHPPPCRRQHGPSARCLRRLLGRRGRRSSSSGAGHPAGKTDWTADDVIPFVQSMHIGVEVASSPLATLNDLGPGAVISDFGNNWGVVVGAGSRTGARWRRLPSRPSSTANPSAPAPPTSSPARLGRWPSRSTSAPSKARCCAPVTSSPPAC